MSKPESRFKRAGQFSLSFLAYGYPLVLVSIWILFRLEGDRWWFATLLMYGPRWIYLAPLALLVPIATLVQRRLLLPLGLSGAIALFLLMGLCIPYRTWGRSWAGEMRPSLRVLSYNIERYRVPGHAFSTLLDQEQPDLLAVQECAGVGRWTDWWNRHHEWYAVHRGELMVASRFPIKDVEVSHSRWPAERKPVLNAIYCVIEAPSGDVGFCNLHLDTPRRALTLVLDREKGLDLEDANYADYRLDCRRRESEDLLRWLNQFPEPKIIAGDFNLAGESRIYQSHWAKYRDAFSWAGWGFGFTKQTVIRQREYGLRIDRILTDAHWTPSRSWVGPDLGSDHSPLFADIFKE